MADFQQWNDMSDTQRLEAYAALRARVAEYERVETQWMEWNSGLRARVAELEREKDSHEIALARIWVKLRALIADADYALNGTSDNKAPGNEEGTRNG